MPTVEATSSNNYSLVGNMLTSRNGSLFENEADHCNKTDSDVGNNFENEADHCNKVDSDTVNTLDVGLLNVLIKIPNLQIILPQVRI